MRFDLRTIASWVEPQSRVLDLGCGAGELLQHLQDNKGVVGTGIELNGDKVIQGIHNGVNIIHGDIYDEIMDYQDRSFDYVVLSQTLQQVFRPARLIHEMLRVGRRGIVSFPNFSHYRNRAFFFFRGRAPISKALPYEWFDTPNIRVIPLKDFKRFCSIFEFAILQETAISTHRFEEKGRTVRFLPNMFAKYGIYLLGKKKDVEKRG